MKTILSLTAKDFLTGLAPTEDTQGKGLWSSAPGLNPFIDGELQGRIGVSATPTDLTGSVVVDTPIAWVQDSTGGATDYAYFIGSSGNFYSVNLSNDTVVNLRATTNRIGTLAGSSNAVAGIWIFQPKGGTRYLYYMQDDRIGRWSMATPTSYSAGEWTDNYIGVGGTVDLTADATKIVTTTHHPVHTMFDEVFIGNKYAIAQMKDNGAGGITFTTNVLDMAGDDITTAISDDGYYLVIGTTKNKIGNTVNSPNKVLFWDKNTSSWQQEHKVFDNFISAIKNVNGQIYIVGGRGLWVTSFTQSPFKLKTLGATDRVNFGKSTAADQLNDAIIFGNLLMTYGRVTPDAPRAFFTPLTGITGDVSTIAAGVLTNNMYVGTSGNKLYKISYSPLGYSETTQSTVYIDLGRKYAIAGYRVIFSGWQATSVFKLTAQAQDTNLIFDNVTTVKSGNSQTVYSNKQLQTDLVQLQMIFSTASFGVRRIELLGEPINE